MSVLLVVILHCALAAAQCIVIGPVCLFATGGRAVSEPYYSQRARSVCVSLSAFFIPVSAVCSRAADGKFFFRRVLNIEWG